MAGRERSITAFGEYLRDQMTEKNLSLREVARRSGIDASNLSKMERGKVFPPQKRATLDNLAKALELDESGRKRIIELSAFVNGIVPEELEHVRENKAIPLLLRAINNKQLDEAQVKKLVDIIEEENSWQGRVED